MVNVYKNDKEKAIVEQLKEFLKDLGFRIVKIRITKKNEDKNCAMAIERIDSNSVNLRDCRKVYSSLQALINDNILPLAEHSLEVSSPGINKPLTRVEDFKAAISSNIKVQTIYKIENKKSFKGKLESVQENQITLTTASDNKKYDISFNEISEAYLKVY